MFVDKLIKLKSYPPRLRYCETGKLPANYAFSLAEVILAIAIFSMIASVLVSLALNSVNAIGLSQEESEANYLVDQMPLQYKAMSKENWEVFLSNLSYVNDVSKIYYDLNSPNHRYFSTNSTNGNWRSSWPAKDVVNLDVINEKYLNITTMSNVCRDTGNAIVVCPNGAVDNNIKYLTMTIIWDDSYGREHQVKRETYLIK